MPSVIDWNPTVDPSGLVQRTRDALASGGAVVLPGDGGYVVLWRPGTAPERSSPALLVFGPEEAAALGVTIPKTARRLMARAWPAALTVEVPASTDVPGAANGFVRFRFPEHPLFDLVVPTLADLGPVLIADTGAESAADAVTRAGTEVTLAIDAGLRGGPKPTVVRCSDTEYTVTEPGAFPKEEIDRLAARIVLFVCTGNTCRSPLAEGLAKKLLADRLRCATDELPARGFWVLSAGVAAYGGGPASEESLAVAAEFGADLGRHASRPLNPQLLAAADDVIAMTHGHLHALATRYPGAGPGARLLCGDEDLDDPIGASLDVYRECARVVVRHLERILPEWVAS
ncbi:hypothetical protein R5W23_000928 [Gemmata sp. JC673]|uniref:protein-tyrosine-phosphatase n=1 Tax=Gemmata algarum TaxID=2975278 RepID=A0ABU5EZ59_9BACT|nr:hypothetical protein [Gemmata algarum]MDY3559770.1 hypothetical protein [Gemmata algarum]